MARRRRRRRPRGAARHRRRRVPGAVPQRGARPRLQGRGGHQPDDRDRDVERRVGRHRRAQPDQPAARHAARGRVGGGRRRRRRSPSRASPTSRSSAIFAVVAAVIAVLMVTRLEQRNVHPRRRRRSRVRSAAGFYEEESGREVVYRVKRLPVALGVSLVAGNVSAALGIGGGILKVPVLNAWCGVPMRAAAATSALMIGVTAVASVPIQYAQRLRQPAAGRGRGARRAARLARRLLVRRPRAGEVAEAADGARAGAVSSASISGRACERAARSRSAGSNIISARLLVTACMASAVLLVAGLCALARRPGSRSRHVMAAERRARRPDGDADPARGRVVRRSTCGCGTGSSSRRPSLVLVVLLVTVTLASAAVVEHAAERSRPVAIRPQSI